MCRLFIQKAPRHCIFSIGSFGVTRSYGGDEDHPTLNSSEHIHRLLSLYTPVSTCVTGNVNKVSNFCACRCCRQHRKRKERPRGCWSKVVTEISSTAQDPTLTAQILHTNSTGLCNLPPVWISTALFSQAQEISSLYTQHPVGKCRVPRGIFHYFRESL